MEYKAKWTAGEFERRNLAAPENPYVNFFFFFFHRYCVREERIIERIRNFQSRIRIFSGINFKDAINEIFKIFSFKNVFFCFFFLTFQSWLSLMWVSNSYSREHRSHMSTNIANLLCSSLHSPILYFATARLMRKRFISQEWDLDIKLRERRNALCYELVQRARWRKSRYTRVLCERTVACLSTEFRSLKGSWFFRQTFSPPIAEVGKSRAIPWLARCKRRRVTHPRWSLGRARDYLLRAGELTTNHPMGKPVAGRTNGARSLTTSLLGPQRAFQRHEFAPRRELMETRRGMPYALIKRNVRLSSIFLPLYLASSLRVLSRFGIKQFPTNPFLPLQKRLEQKLYASREN